MFVEICCVVIYVRVFDYRCKFSIWNIKVVSENVFGQGREQEQVIPPRYQGLVFKRGSDRGKGRGQGREGGPDPFSETGVEN